MSKNSLTHLAPAPNYYQYLESIQKNNAIAKFKGAEFYLKKFNLLKSIIDIMPCVVYIGDYRTRQYLYMSENVKTLFGYSASEYMTYGQDFQINKIHPDDLEVFKSKVFGEFVEYSRTILTVDLKKTVFSLNLRCKRKDDTYIQYLQQYVVLERDENNNPLMTLGVATDISAYKSDNKMIFSVTKYNEKGRELKIYSPNVLSINQNISKREGDVLKLILKGKTSKQIAETLFLSYYTVRAHRRNLLEKTNCKNVIELGNYAFTNGLV